MTRVEFRLPDPGEGITEAELVEWYVEVGQEVDEDDTLCEIETDKALVEVPAPHAGTVEELRAGEGDTVPVGEVIVVLETERPVHEEEVKQPKADREGEPGAEVASEPSEAPPEEAEREPEAPPAEGVDQPVEERVFAAPSTRRYARERGVDLSKIEGSGPQGRILREDVDAHPQQREEPGAVEAERPAVPEEGVEIREEQVVRRPIRGLRKRIAENVVRSMRTIPHVTAGFEADATELVTLKERLDRKLDERITYTPVFVKAVVPALKEFPIVNASVDDQAEEIVEKRYYNVGVATHTEDGLMVPVVKDVDTMSLVEVADELERLVQAARERTIDIEDLEDGTFTVTNLGSHGRHRTFGTPIINHPQAAILGLGPIKNEPVAVSDEDVEVRKRISLFLSYDHRIIDGVTATQFVEYLIAAIEDADVLVSRL